MGGECQVPADPPADSHGTFQIGKQLYYEDGYDVHMFDEDNTYSGVEPEIVSAIQKRGVSSVIIFGYSHGGGSTYIVAKYLVDNGLTAESTISYTAYTDAVINTIPWITPEDRRPPSTNYLTNRYETNTLLPHGSFVPGTEDEDDLTSLGLTHSDIDDYDDVKNNIVSHILLYSR